MPAATLRLDAFLPYRLSFTSNLVSELVAGTYRTLFDLDIPEWRLIAVAAEGEGVTQQAIGLATLMDKVTVSRAAARLVKRGLLARAPNPGDRRSHLLALTAAGRRLYAKVAPQALALERKLIAGLDAEEVAAFTATLRKLDALVIGMIEAS